MSPFERSRALELLGSEQFDVLVVGGGITGAGVALDFASRGLKIALVERADFASGTSSKSSKLVHGGLRYLQQGDFALVRESLVERRVLLANAGHLVTRLPFLVPVFGRAGVVTNRAARSLSTGLWLYDLLGAWRIGSRHHRVGSLETCARLPFLRSEQVAGGFVYEDAHADDARLTLAVLRTAVLDHGAVAVNYAGVNEILVGADGKVAGARVSPVVTPGGAGALGDTAEGPEIDVHARAVVNATGVWADDVATLADGAHPRSLRPAKGVHVSVPRAALPCDVATVLPVSGDRRTIFIVPWPECDSTYLGTTDTDYDGPLDGARCDPGDVTYLLDAVNASTSAALGPEDVTGVWAGLRPLLATAKGRRARRTADLSRRHTVRTSPNGLITVTGGKLTTYRRMAEDTARATAAVLDDPRLLARSPTARLRLRGAPGSPAATDDHLALRYGTEADEVRALAARRPALAEPIAPRLPYLGAEVAFAVREEMAQSLDDVLARRMRAVIQDAAAAIAAAPAVARIMAEELGWSPDDAAGQVERFCASIEADLRAAGLPASTGAPR